MTRTDLSGPDGLHLPDDDSPAAYDALLRDAARTGQCPVWIGSAVTELVHPLPVDPVGTGDRSDPAAVLREWWAGPCRFDCGCRGPFQVGFPAELVRSGSADRSADDRTIAAAVALGASERWSRLALVATKRPASVPDAMGWAGICNYPWQDLAGLSAVLRSWEERFGAVLVRIDRSTLLLAVADPPRTERESLHVAAEHFTFCPDQQDPQNGRVWTIPTYAAAIRDAPTWRFWWD